MQTHKLVIAYDGTAYHGWQLQPDVPTIAGILEKRFLAVFKIPIKLVGASRTDAGVHALGQIASFTLADALPLDKVRFAWNNALPRDIHIRALEAAPDTFHPQRDVVEKTYYYHFFEQRPLPFMARYGFFSGKINQEKLNHALQIFVGTHDFRSFCTGHEMESTIRTINSIELHYYKRFGIHRITVKGPGFLRYMIRRIAGACIDVASSTKPLEELVLALEEKNPHQHLHVAPSSGLLLHGIRYN